MLTRVGWCGVVFGLLASGAVPWIERAPAQPGSPVGAAPPALLSQPEETAEARDARMSWWRDARFGIFIHWGLYAIPAGVWDGREVGGVGEWIMHSARVPAAEYERLAAAFNPVKFDADAWADLARRSGARYVVITSKHHDGFCLWPSELTAYDVADATPFGRDIIGELSRACDRRGVRFGVYHSIMDWHHPDYLPRRDWDQRPGVPASFPRFADHLRGQVAELIGRYPEIAVLWFDGEWEETWTHELGLDLYARCRAQNPALIINNRVDKGRDGMAGLTTEGRFAGDFGTPEQEVPATGIPGVDWESCMTMNGSWGYKASDDSWKSPRDLVLTLCDTASKGGNFLLNVGPTAEGEIVAASVERLEAMGRWLAVNGESIYGTEAGPFRSLPFGRATRRGPRLYLHVFDWPADGRLLVPGLRTGVVGARILGSDAAVAWAGHADGVVLDLPRTAPGEIATVVALDLAGDPVVTEVPIRAGADGVVRLFAAAAQVSGPSLRVEEIDGMPNLGFWNDGRAAASWLVELPAGTYDATALVSGQPSSAGQVFELVAGAGGDPIVVTGIVPDTGSWRSFISVGLGRVSTPGGPVRITVRSRDPVLPAPLMNLRSVELKPAG